MRRELELPLCSSCDSLPCEPGRTVCRPCLRSGEGYDDGSEGRKVQVKYSRDSWYMRGYQEGARMRRVAKALQQ